MTNYAIDYGIRKDTRVLPFENGANGKEFTIGNENEKVTFIGSLSEADTIWVEMGSGADYFCLGAAQHGVKVYRLPTHLAKEARGGEPKSLTAQALAALARSRPEAFYPLRVEELPILRVRINTREYLHYQREVRGSVERRVEVASREIFLAEAPSDVTFEAFRKQRMANDPAYQGCLAREKELHAEIERSVKQLPVYEGVFRRIRGCGPVTAGLIIGEIGDIRRFPKDHGERLRGYAGYAVFDGVSSVRMRSKGQRLTYQPNLTIAVWYFSQFGVSMRPRGFSGWRELYDAKKAQLQRDFPEKAREVHETRYSATGEKIGEPIRRKIPVSLWEEMDKEEVQADGSTLRREAKGLALYSPLHLDKMAKRYVGEKFLMAVHWYWHTFLEGGEVPELLEPGAPGVRIGENLLR